MTNLTKEQRDNRDQMSARLAIAAASERGQIAGIVVDDDPKAERMLRRVIDISTSMKLSVEVQRRGVCIDVIIGEGRVRILTVDQIERPM